MTLWFFFSISKPSEKYFLYWGLNLNLGFLIGFWQTIVLMWWRRKTRWQKISDWIVVIFYGHSQEDFFYIEFFKFFFFWFWHLFIFPGFFSEVESRTIRVESSGHVSLSLPLTFREWWSRTWSVWAAKRPESLRAAVARLQKMTKRTNFCRERSPFFSRKPRAVYGDACSAPGSTSANSTPLYRASHMTSQPIRADRVSTPMLADGSCSQIMKSMLNRFLFRTEERAAVLRLRSHAQVTWGHALLWTSLRPLWWNRKWVYIKPCHLSLNTDPIRNEDSSDDAKGTKKQRHFYRKVSLRFWNMALKHRAVF